MKRISDKDFVEQKNPILHRRIKKVEFPLSKELHDNLLAMRQYIVDSLDEKLCEKYDLTPAVGIAANQIGFDARACVLYILGDNDNVIMDEIMINPRILSHSMEESYLSAGEGCLSVATMHKGYVYRKKEIKVNFYTIDGENKTLNLDGFLAIAVQHEIDHLNGILYIDKINKENPFEVKVNSIEI